MKQQLFLICVIIAQETFSILLINEKMFIKLPLAFFQGLLCLASFLSASITTIFRFRIKRSINLLTNWTLLLHPNRLTLPTICFGLEIKLFLKK